MENKNKMQYLVDKLNHYRDQYYNHNNSAVSDEIYDRLYDELEELEKESGFVLANSPTSTVGYKPVSNLNTVKHPIPLLSLDKTQDMQEVIDFIGDKTSLLMHKLDGLTVRLDYEDGKLVLAATRGNGTEGEDITHNIPAFMNVPMIIPYKKRLSIAGEAIIHRKDFDGINAGLSDGDKFKNIRNMVSGSVRVHDPQVCAKRKVSVIIESNDDF